MSGQREGLSVVSPVKLYENKPCYTARTSRNRYPVNL